MKIFLDVQIILNITDGFCLLEILDLGHSYPAEVKSRAWGGDGVGCWAFLAVIHHHPRPPRPPDSGPDEMCEKSFDTAFPELIVTRFFRPRAHQGAHNTIHLAFM